VNYPLSITADAIVVEVEFDGPTGSGMAKLALDTGAVQTAIAPNHLAIAGYGPSTPMQRVQITSASGVANAFVLDLIAFRALGQEMLNFPVVAHTLPIGSNINGLLGLDFFRGKELNIDFRAGFITLN
jgi:predicted aspartyl protease